MDSRKTFGGVDHSVTHSAHDPAAIQYAADMRRRRSAANDLRAYDAAGHRDPLDALVEDEPRSVAIAWELGGGRYGLLATRRDARRMEVAAGVRFRQFRGDRHWVVPAGVDLAGAALLCGLQLVFWSADV